MRYHFRIHKEKDGCWGECVELTGCISQADDLEELEKNLKEALDLYLDEPEDSKMIIPPPRKGMQGRNIVSVKVDSQIAIASLIRSERLKRRWSQRTTAKELGMPLYSYQRLEHSRTANPEWKTLIKLRRIFPGLDLNEAA